MYGSSSPRHPTALLKSLHSVRHVHFFFNIAVRANVCWTVFEGDKVRAEQLKRIEEVQDGRAQIPEGASDKESMIRMEGR